jgi:hypothetical protein
LRQRGLGDLDVIGGGVATGVALAEDHRDGFTGAALAVVDPRPDRVVPNPRLKVAAASSFAECTVIRVASRSTISGAFTVTAWSGASVPAGCQACKSRNCLAGFNGIVWQVQVL